MAQDDLVLHTLYICKIELLLLFRNLTHCIVNIIIFSVCFCFYSSCKVLFSQSLCKLLIECTKLGWYAAICGGCSSRS